MENVDEELQVHVDEEDGGNKIQVNFITIEFNLTNQKHKIIKIYNCFKFNS